MSQHQKPGIGRIVHYTLSEQDALQINRRRNDAAWSRTEHQENANGVIVHSGNDAHVGDVFPMIITRVWGDESVNGQVFLDGNDTLWVTSVSQQRPADPAERHFVWPTRS